MENLHDVGIVLVQIWQLHSSPSAILNASTKAIGIAHVPISMEIPPSFTRLSFLASKEFGSPVSIAFSLVTDVERLDIFGWIVDEVGEFGSLSLINLLYTIRKATVKTHKRRVTSFIKCRVVAILEMKEK